MKTFVEIGTSNFNTLRHLCDKGWKGIMVEPIEIALNKIPDHDNLTKVNGAIDKDFNIRNLTKLKDKFWNDPNIDRDYLGMASLQSNNILSQDNFYQDMIEEIEVGCVTFEFLMEQLGITEVDYLKIDTEGLDYDILNSINFNKFNIKAIRAEHQHVNLSLLVDLLEKNNYLVDILENDIIAIKG
jgi:FkbM family methyltransferase